LPKRRSESPTTNGQGGEKKAGVGGRKTVREDGGTFSPERHGLCEKVTKRCPGGLFGEGTRTMKILEAKHD